MVFLRVALTAVVFFSLRPSSPSAGPDFSDWSEPENLGPVINSSDNDAGGIVSKDGLSLYFHSGRPGGFGGTDLYVSQRRSLNEPWGPPINLGADVNSAQGDSAAVLSRDEHWLFFNSMRPGGFGSLDIWVTYRQHTHDDFGWQPPVNVGPGVNSPAVETNCSFFENDDAGAPQLLFSSNRPGGLGMFDIYVSELLPDGTFGPASPITALSSTFSEPGLSIRFDGLEVFLFSTRPPSFGSQDLWTATRETVFDSWSTPTNLGALVNSSVRDSQPFLAPDRQTLYFASDRVGGFGDLDLYVTTRTKHKP